MTPIEMLEKLVDERSEYQLRIDPKKMMPKNYEVRLRQTIRGIELEYIYFDDLVASQAAMKEYPERFK